MASNVKKYIIIKITDRFWAWPLQSSNHFFHLDYTLPLPKDKLAVVGIAYQHGQIVTVLKIDKLLNQTSAKFNYTQALWFDYREDIYALQAEPIGEIVTVKSLFTDKQSPIFKKYFKYQGQKVYCLEPDILLAHLKIYDQQ